MRPLVSDERLSRRLAIGEAAAFDELYRRYAHRLSAYASTLLGDRAAGEDVAQVALLNAYQALRSGKTPEQVRPWLYRIAHNEAVDMLARRRDLLHRFEPEDRPAPEDGSATRGALLDALAQLPDRQRRAYVLREVHGLRIAEIAAELELGVSQVEQALFAARNRMAEELVFSDGLTCAAAQQLAEGPLAGIERRALRRHFRTCDHCRASGIRVAPGLGLGLSFDWARGRLADLLVGGAAPAAAKVGAVVAAGAVATGVTAGSSLVQREPRPPRLGGGVAQPSAPVVRPAVRVVAVAMRTPVVHPARAPVISVAPPLRDDGEPGDETGQRHELEGPHDVVEAPDRSGSESGDRELASTLAPRARTGSSDDGGGSDGGSEDRGDSPDATRPADD